MTDARSIWDDLPSLPDDQLRLLTEAAISVLWPGGDPADPDTAGTAPAGTAPADPAPADPARLPPRALAGELRTALAGSGVAPSDVDRIVTDEAVGRRVALAILEPIGRQPALAEEVARVYQARQNMMIIDGGTLLAAALLLVAMKIKKVSVGKQGVELDFYPVQAGVLDSIRRLFGG